MVWRVYADGRPDELVRGVDIVGTPLTVLTQIAATGDTTSVFNGICGAESGSVPVSAAAPAMLFSEMEVQKTKVRRHASTDSCRRRSLDEKGGGKMTPRTQRLEPSRHGVQRSQH